MKVNVKLNKLRISPSKVRLVADVVRNQPVVKALSQLAVTSKGSAQPMIKLLASAVANAEHNFGLDKDNLYVSEIHVDEGVTMKRWLPRAHGRATKLLKRTSQISVTLAEIKEGENRKTPTQIKKMQDAAKRVASDDDTGNATKVTKSEFNDTISTKGATGGGVTKKMFRRKSM